MNTIENQLSTLKPATQAALARRILDVSSRRRQCRQQRRRDCFVGLTGLLTGIAATVLVMMFPFTATEPTTVYVYVPVVQEVAGNQNPHIIDHHPVIDRHSREGGNPDERIASLAPRLRGGDQSAVADSTARRSVATFDPDSLDLDVWIARYEKLLRHRLEVASRTVYVPPIATPTLPDGMSPWEYRRRLLEGIDGKAS